MPIEFVAGDLFANEHQTQAFAHGCNCQGSMGAGIAKEFRARYPQMFEQFRAKCKANPREFNLGDAWLWKSEADPWVFNLGTQEEIWHARASYQAIETALTAMKTMALSEGLRSIAMPRIGVGYGGLSWKKVKAIVERVFADWLGRLVVYETFVPAASSDDQPPDPDPPKSPFPAKQTKKAAPRFRTRSLTIACTDLEKSVTFYETVLGAKRKPTDVGAVPWFRLGTLDINLMPNAEQPSPAEFPTHAMQLLWLEVDNLARAAQWFADNGVKIEDEGDGQFMTIADPDGLLIEVWEKADVDCITTARG